MKGSDRQKKPVPANRGESRAAKLPLRHTVTLEQTARIIGTTVKVIRGAIRSGELEAIQLGRRLLSYENRSSESSSSSQVGSCRLSRTKTIRSVSMWHPSSNRGVTFRADDLALQVYAWARSTSHS